MADLPAGLTFRLLHVGVAVPELDAATKMLGAIFGSEVGLAVAGLPGSTRRAACWLSWSMQ